MADIKSIVKRLLGLNPTIKPDPAAAYRNESYAQEGEDMVLKRYLYTTKNGFYVDIGAHHPFRFSNTYAFYQMGWRGINVDAMPGSMEPFRLHRPADINLEIPISNQQQLLTYHIFNEPALNTFSAEEAAKKDGLGAYKIVDKISIETYPLAAILDEHLPKDTRIDFLSIDVEGLDLAVLQSNNWEKYRPEMILAESLRNSLDQLANNNVYLFLTGQGYQLVAKTFNTMFFKKIAD